MIADTSADYSDHLKYLGRCIQDIEGRQPTKASKRQLVALRQELLVLEAHQEQMTSATRLFENCKDWTPAITKEMGSDLVEGTFYDLHSALLQQGKTDKAAFSFLGTRLQKDIQALGDCACHDEAALEALARVVSFSVAALNKASKDNPSAPAVASTFQAWPIFKGASLRSGAGQEKLLASLKVGTRCRIRSDATARIDFRKERAQLALYLVEILQEAKSRFSGKEVNVIPKELHWLRNAAVMPALNVNSFEQWWMVAKEMLEFHYGPGKTCPAVKRLYPKLTWKDTKKDIRRLIKCLAQPL
jgi:hypothetical protein